MWSLRGEYVENCNCALFCPCLLGPRDAVGGFPSARPTEGHCRIPAVFHVETGVADGITLDGLTVFLAIDIPGRMSDGDWRVAPYLPATASAAQSDALARIFLGRAGGPIARVATMVSEWRAPQVVPIAYQVDGFQRRIAIPGILDLEVEAMTGADGASEIWIRNVKHMASRLLALALGRRTTYTADGVCWDHAGRNAHYGPFEWHGEP